LMLFLGRQRTGRLGVRCYLAFGPGTPTVVGGTRNAKGLASLNYTDFRDKLMDGLDQLLLSFSGGFSGIERISAIFF
jgi:hypothetical protein